MTQKPLSLSSSVNQPTVPTASSLTMQESRMASSPLTKKDTIELQPQNESGWSGIKGKLLKLFRWLFLCLCCRSSKPQPDPVHSLKAEDHPASDLNVAQTKIQIFPEEICKHEHKKCIEDPTAGAAEEDSNEQLIEFIRFYAEDY